MVQPGDTVCFMSAIFLGQIRRPPMAAQHEVALVVDVAQIAHHRAGRLEEQAVANFVIGDAIQQQVLLVERLAGKKICVMKRFIQLVPRIEK